MKKIFFALLVILVSVLLDSCQKEEKQLIIPEETNAIPRASDLGKLIEQVTLHDGSFDDIVDKSHCFSINLPYSIFINGNRKEINSVEDYASLDGTEDIVINFPVIVNLATHRQVFLNTIEDLEELKLQCILEDQDIECIDFNYPVTLLLFNTTTSQIQSKIVDHDAEWYRLMDNLEIDVLMSIKYPVILKTFSGQSIEVSHNTVLTSEILEWARSCDEMD